MAETETGSIGGAVKSGTTGGLAGAAIGGGVALGAGALLASFLPGGEEIAEGIKELIPDSADLNNAYDGVKNAVLGSVDYVASDFSPEALESIDKFKDGISAIDPNDYGSGAGVAGAIQDLAIQVLENPNATAAEKEALMGFKDSLDLGMSSPEVQTALKPMGEALVNNGGAIAERVGDAVDAAKSAATYSAGLAGAGAGGVIGAGVGAGTGSTKWADKINAERSAPHHGGHHRS